MSKCNCVKPFPYTDNQGTNLCGGCGGCLTEYVKPNPMAVSKNEVIAIMKKLGDEYKLPSWNRTSSVLLEAMDTMNRMYAYGVDKD